jgi:hypothetical protein
MHLAPNLKQYVVSKMSLSSQPTHPQAPPSNVGSIVINPDMAILSVHVGKETPLQPITYILYGSTLQPKYSLWFFIHKTCVFCGVKKAINYVLACYIACWLSNKVHVVWNLELPL